MDDFSNYLKCYNFAPDKNFRHKAYQMLNRLHWAVPSDAHLNLQISHDKGRYIANCKVASSIFLYESHKSEKDLNVLLARLESDILTELHCWKEARSIYKDIDSIQSDMAG